jgi:signal transduction histidine kinase
MRRWPTFNLPHRTGLLVLLLPAVLLPLSFLLFVQYRSFADLEGKTRVAVQENLRQMLQSFAHRVGANAESFAAETLSSIDAVDVEQERLPQIADRLLAIRQSHPEISLAFVVVHCLCRARNFALFAAPEGVRRIDHDDFKQRPEVKAVLEIYQHAELLRGHGASPQRALFEQSSCSMLPVESSGSSQFFVFLPLHKADGHGQIGFAGIALKPGYIREHLLPQTISELLRDGEDKSGPIINVLDEHNREIYVNRGGLRQREVVLPFSPVFRKWKLAIGYQDTTIAALARNQFRQNLLLIGVAMALLLVGLILTLRATAREMKLVEAKATFVSNVSHELKTPLALIRLFAETLELGRVRNAEEAHGYYRIIHRESRRLTRLINNILDFSRIEAGRRQYQFAETEVAEVVSEALQIYDYQLKSAGFEVVLNVQAALPPVLLDREAIAQSVLNLLDNAVRYSDRGKRIKVSVGARANDIAIEVADDGIGIPRAEHQRIFEKFYRVSTGAVHATKGSGLGLAIVKHIVEAHRGRVQVESTPGKGSRFSILLPVSKTATAGAVAENLGADTGGYSVAENPHY